MTTAMNDEQAANLADVIYSVTDLLVKEQHELYQDCVANLSGMSPLSQRDNSRSVDTNEKFFSSHGHDLAFNALQLAHWTLGYSPISLRNPQSDRANLDISSHFVTRETVRGPNEKKKKKIRMI